MLVGNEKKISTPCLFISFLGLNGSSGVGSKVSKHIT